MSASPSPSSSSSSSSSSLVLPWQYSEALLHVLRNSGVQFLRFCCVDAANQLRCKAVPLSHLLERSSNSRRSASLHLRREGCSYDDEGENGDDDTEDDEDFSETSCLHHRARVAFASVVVAGLPNYGDACIPGSGLDASGTVLLCPDLSTLTILPYNGTTAVVFGSLIDPPRSSAGAPPPSSPQPQPASKLCTRSLLHAVLDRAAAAANDDSGGGGFVINVGFEIEFTLFEYSCNGRRGKPVDRSNFASTTTLDQQQEYLSELVAQLSRQGISLELLHAESAPGQLEVVIPCCWGRRPRDIVRGVDSVYLAMETIRAVARQRNLRAIFLPKMLPDVAGNGLHLHLSTSSRTRPCRKNNGRRAGRRDGDSARGATDFTASIRPPLVHHHQRLQESFMEGVLMHLPALAAFTLPTVNSYRRVGPGCWTGSSVGWALDDKEVPIRAVPPSVSYSSSSSFSNSLAAESRAAPPSFEHFEYKICDATANLYLALSAIVLAGMHGVRTGATLRAPITTTATPSCDCNAHGTAFTSSLPPALPRSVDEALDYLEADEHLRRQLPSALMQAYVAVRRAEARRSEGATLERELEDALERA